jgi:hypothetical protein
LGQKDHYTFNIPIQPNKGENETLFEVQYHLAYSGKYTFTPHLQMPADNLVVYAAKGIEFSGAQGATFKSTQEDPRVQTYVAKAVRPGQNISFTISGEGQMPVQGQGGAMGQSGMGDAGSADAARPGGGIGAPIGSPDPLSKYKWWILGSLALLLIGAAAFLLRKRSETPEERTARLDEVAHEPRPVMAAARPTPPAAAPAAAPSNANAYLLSVLKDELFAIESEKLSGTLSPAEYTQIKTGLEALLKRTLSRK